MTPQTANFVAAALEALSDAKGNMSINIYRQAARLAYYAQFHAAQALIFERTGKITKTHKGVQAQFHKLGTTEPRLAPGFPGNLSAAYRYKQIADYDAGAAVPVTQTEARDAIEVAEQFVAAIRMVLLQPSGSAVP